MMDFVTVEKGKIMAEYIDKEAAIEAAKHAWAKGLEPSQYIEIIPAADVASVKHERWIEYTKVIIPEPYNKWEQAWKCSKCGFDDGFVAYNYCPNCGAKMEGECDV